MKSKEERKHKRLAGKECIKQQVRAKALQQIHLPWLDLLPVSLVSYVTLDKLFHHISFIENGSGDPCLFSMSLWEFSGILHKTLSSVPATHLL